MIWDFPTKTGTISGEGETEDEARADALRKLKTAPPPPKATVPDAYAPPEDNLSFGDYAEDFGRSAASGLAEGTAALPGLPGDIESLGRSAINLGSSFITGENAVSSDPYLDTSTETTANVREMMKPIVDIHHTPKTTAGEYAKTAASFVPGAVIMGPGSVVKGGIANVAKNAVKYGIAPGVISEGAGQATEGTDLEPWARAAGALVGPSLAGGVATTLATKGEAVVEAMRKTAQGVRVAKKLKIIDGLIEKAKDDASVMRGVGIGEALSKRLLNLKRSGDWQKFTPDERHAINRALKMGVFEQAAIDISPTSRFGFLAALLAPQFGYHGSSSMAVIASVPEAAKVAAGLARSGNVRRIRNAVAKGKPPPPLDDAAASGLRGEARVAESQHPIIERWGHKYQWDESKGTYRIMLDAAGAP